CVARHRAGDWGDLDADDWALNDQAVRHARGRLLSAYRLPERPRRRHQRASGVGDQRRRRRPRRSNDDPLAQRLLATTEPVTTAPAEPAGAFPRPDTGDPAVSLAAHWGCRTPTGDFNSHVFTQGCTWLAVGWRCCRSPSCASARRPTSCPGWPSRSMRITR